MTGREQRRGNVGAARPGVGLAGRGGRGRDVAAGVLAALVFLVATAGPARARDHGPAPAGDAAAYQEARPVFEKYCTRCHASTGSAADPKAIEHLDMSAYPFGGHHADVAGMAVRTALGGGGAKATMPHDHPGAVQGAELALVLAWADAFDAAHPMAMAMGDRDHDHDHDTDEHAAGDHDMHGGHDMHDMGGMHDMEGMHDMPMSTPLGLAMGRTGSGTAWQPDATPMAMHHRKVGDWMLMLHYTMHGGLDAQGTSRGDSRGVGLGWLMGMATHALGGGEFGARVMLSPEPLLDGKRGYPLLLQTGEEVGGVPLHDRQHPHDLFMELAVRYAHALGDDVAVELYAAPAGEPALGPVAFPHRPYALYDMTAALGHHWQDSTHVSFGVATAGVYGRRWKVEGSYFNGREPDEDRYDVNLRAPDSFAGRVTINPTAAWSVEASYGYLKAPEAREPDVSVQRAVASATYAGHGVDATAVIGHNAPSAGPATSAGLVELSAHPIDHVVPFGRVELVQKTGADLQLGAPADDDRVFTMASIGAGAVYELDPIDGVTAGLGARGTLDVIGGGLSTYYGTTTPLGGMVYVEVHPARAR